MSFTAHGYLVASTARRWRPSPRVFVRDPATNGPASISEYSTASPTVGPDGDVYFGVIETEFPNHNDRGWLLHFSGDLSTDQDAGLIRLGRHRLDRAGLDGALLRRLVEPTWS